MGGWTAVSVIQDQPERVSALVLVNSTGGIRDPALDQHFEAFKTWHPRQIWAGAYAPDFPQREPARAFLYQQITAWNVRRPAISEPSSNWRIHGSDRRTANSNALLTGEGDSLIPPPLVERVARQIPHAQLVKIATGHSPYFETPEAGNRIVLDFLREEKGASVVSWQAPRCVTVPHIR